jgi:hypothetical protein
MGPKFCPPQITGESVGFAANAPADSPRSLERRGVMSEKIRETAGKLIFPAAG